jgi:plasmid stabilization system protein ParE
MTEQEKRALRAEAFKWRKEAFAAVLQAADAAAAAAEYQEAWQDAEERLAAEKRMYRGGRKP